MSSIRIPFYKNTKDNTHCFQACLKILLKYFFPSEKYSFKELDKITGKKEGKWTWPMTGILYLYRRGLKVKHYNGFNYAAFGKNNLSYSRRVWRDPDFYNAQIANSDIPYESEVSRKYATKGIHRQRRATEKDLVRLLSEKYLLICNVNYYALHLMKGYSGHFVVVYRIENNIVYLQDPGLPGHRDEVVSLSVFLKAWNGTDLIAVKKLT